MKNRFQNHTDSPEVSVLETVDNVCSYGYLFMHLGCSAGSFKKGV